jgi:hypothetical protein
MQLDKQEAPNSHADCYWQTHVATELDPTETLTTRRLRASESTHYDAFGRGQHTQIP